MTVRESVDVAIVGAGISGLALGFELIRRTPLRVAVIAPGAKESGAATAAAQGVSAIKGLLLAREPLFQAKLSGHRHLKSWLAEVVKASSGFSIAQDYGGVGEMCPDLASFQKVAGRVFQRRFQGAFGPVFGRFGTQAFGGFYYPGDFWFDPRTTLDALERALELSPTGRARRIEANVEFINTAQSILLRLSDGSAIASSKVVLAAGWKSPELLQQLPGATPWLTTPAWKEVPGNTMEWTPAQVEAYSAPRFAPTGGVVRSFVRGVKSITLKPDGKVVAGSWNDDEEPSDFLSGLKLEAALFSSTPALRDNFDSAVIRRGIRLRCRDRAPVCGPLGDAAMQRVWLFTGFYKNGLQLAPLLAPVVADALAQGDGHLIPAPFSTRRFF